MANTHLLDYERVGLPRLVDETKAQRDARLTREHEQKFERLAQWLGVPELRALVPFSREAIVAALAAGDEYLNTLSLASWDRKHGYAPGETPSTLHSSTCPHCKQLLPTACYDRTAGVWGLLRAAIKRDTEAGCTPVTRAWSLSDTVCVLKHVAKHHIGAKEASA